jgi:drug/metabolite transporter (DMT)-like permease
MTGERRDIDLRAAGLAVLTSVFWGANPVAIKIGLLDVPPLRLAVLRFVVGGVVVLVWGWWTGRLARLSIAPHEWRPLLVLGVLFGVQIGSMNIGTGLTSAAHAAVLLNLYAVHTVVLAHFLIPGDRLTVRRLGGVLIAYAGILVLFAGPGGSSSLVGDAIMFASALVLAERTIYLARAVQHLDAVTILLSQAAIGLVIFLAASLAFEPQPTSWSVRLGVVIAYQGVLVAGFNFIVNLWLLRHYRPSALATFFLTQPIFGVVAASIFTGDHITLELLVASAAVAVGIGLTTR